jgi:hypothetical protein
LNGEYFKNFLDDYEKQVNKNLSDLKNNKLNNLIEQTQKNKENFISNIKKNINNYKLKEVTSEVTRTKINTEELLR